MPDLERSSVLDWLERVEPRIAARVPSAIRPVEDVPEIRSLLADLGSGLDAASPSQVGRGLGGDGGTTAREALAQLGVARMLRLFEWLDGVAQAGAEGDLRAALLRDDDSEAGRLIRATLDALHRQDLLARIFAPERLRALAEMCGEPAGEAA